MTFIAELSVLWGGLVVGDVVMCRYSATPWHGAGRRQALCHSKTQRFQCESVQVVDENVRANGAVHVFWGIVIVHGVTSKDIGLSQSVALSQGPMSPHQCPKILLSPRFRTVADRPVTGA